MSIRTICPNGHNLKVKNKYAGMIGSCPSCGAQVRVPIPDIAHSSLSGTSLVGSLPPEPQDQFAPPSEDVIRTCASCYQTVAPDMQVCPHCGSDMPTLTANANRTCATCFQSVPQDMQVCPNCGTNAPSLTN